MQDSIREKLKLRHTQILLMEEILNAVRFFPFSSVTSPAIFVSEDVSISSVNHFQ